jgi:hypothetical protein
MDVQAKMATHAGVEQLIQRYDLGSVIDRIREVLSHEKLSPAPIESIELLVDRAWDGEAPRLLVRVTFDTDTLSAYDAWRDIYHTLVEPISGPAEDDEALIFEFAGRTQA